MSKPIKCYRITGAYQKVEVFTACKMTRSVYLTSTCIPNKDQPHKERHRVIAEYLYLEHGIPGPSYDEARGSRKKPAK